MPKVNSKFEHSMSVEIKTWNKKARGLYGKMGVYMVFHEVTKECLYVGQSKDLGDRVSRFFNKKNLTNIREFQTITEVNRTKVAHQKFILALICKTKFFVVVTTMGIDKAWPQVVVKEKLDSFERLMIRVKKPRYNMHHTENKF